MSDVVIRVENICKEYRLGTISHGTLSQDLQSGWAKLRGREDPNSKIDSINPAQLNTTNERFCALKDISFDVHQGEIVGIIGRNGAGKSTVLKIISRVTAPTSGTIKIKGRIASLLEVGTGFHPELTGRENVFLNGAILGMHTKEIEQKFDEIVKFAEIDKFIDTPVKRYSSGMYVRLAFAVAAHLEPEILVVDEVLSVGDAQFQKKCIGKMGKVSTEEGKTVLVVSHNMSVISSLSQRGILLEHGCLRFDGPVEEAINQYLNSEQIGTGEVIFRNRLPGDDKVVLHAARITGMNGSPTVNVKIDEPFFIEMEYELFEDGMRVYPNFHIKDTYGQYVFVTADSGIDTDSILKSKKGRYTSRCMIPENLLNTGTFYIGFALGSVYPLRTHFFEQDLLFVTIHDPIDGIKTRITGYSGSVPGTFRPLLHWELEGPK
jgi:lipopolysaccharide transport system ATP-binding protein